jgi:UDP-sulfoquinovose synthase
VADLAELVKRSGAEVGLEVEIDHVENPRVELEEHYYNPVHTKLLDLGLEPTLLGDELVRSMLHTIERHRDRVIDSAIDPRTQWKPGSPAGAASS